MKVSRLLPLAIGALAVSGGVALLSFDIIFAVTLSRNISPFGTNVVAIVASGLEGISVVLLLILLGRQIRYQSRSQVLDSGHRRQHTYMLAGFVGIFGVLSAVASAVLLGMMRNRIGELPRRTIHSSTEGLMAGAFVTWAISLVSQASFVVCMVLVQMKEFRQQIQPYRIDAEPRSFPEMEESTEQRVSTSHGPTDLQNPRSPRPSSARSRAGSDTMSSFRSSLSQVVRPITSKTKLIQNNQRFVNRPSSVDSNHHDPSVSVEDGFDSWDTSAVDAQSRYAVESSASPTPQRFLETIPASPTGSRSPSPGFPLDLEPPKTRQRSRSYSPANSHRNRIGDRPRTARTISPTESMVNESHIHPLFRTDSGTPAPAATPGTTVTAAPESIRSLRMRSESLPSSPLAHSSSFESVRLALEQQQQQVNELERLAELGGERTLTPPIPDFILNGVPRSSVQGQQPRRKTQTGLTKLGEVQEI